MLGFIIFFIPFGGIFIFLGIALVRSIIIGKKEHPYPYCAYPREEFSGTSDPFSDNTDPFKDYNWAGGTDPFHIYFFDE